MTRSARPPIAPAELAPPDAQFVSNGLYYKLARGAGRRWRLFYWAAPTWLLSDKNQLLEGIDLDRLDDQFDRTLRQAARRISHTNLYDNNDFKILVATSDAPRKHLPARKS